MPTQLTSCRVFLASDDTDTPSTPAVGDVMIIPNASYVLVYDGSSWMKDLRPSDLLAMGAILQQLGPGSVNVSILP